VHVVAGDRAPETAVVAVVAVVAEDKNVALGDLDRFARDGHGAAVLDHAIGAARLLDVEVGAGLRDATWDGSTIHHNEIHIPNYNSTAAGPDCFSVGGSGFSIFGNTVMSYVTQTYNSNGATAQHQDGVQILCGSYIKIHSNLFVDLGNATMESGSLYCDVSHVLIYNNVVALTYPRFSTTRGFETRTYGNGFYWRDTHVLNNTFVNFKYAAQAQRIGQQSIAVLHDGYGWRCETCLWSLEHRGIRIPLTAPRCAMAGIHASV
jgi:hypothetical protein